MYLIYNQNGINEWATILKKRFKIPSSEVLTTLQNLRYIINIVRNRRYLTVYISEIITAAEIYGQKNNEYALILYA
jgi:hypothetical protein